MKQKVIKIGSSIGVVIPKPIAKEFGFVAGQEIEIHPDTAYKSILISKPESSFDIKQALETISRAAKYIEQYRSSFEALAKQ